MTRILLAALVAVSGIWWALAPALSEEPGSCSATPTVIEPVKSGPQFDAFRGWLKAHERTLDLAPGELGSHVQWDSAGHLQSKTVSAEERLVSQGIYIVDLDNNGNDEYVMTASEGSGGYLSMLVFRKSGDGFQVDASDALPKPKDIAYDGPWYVSESMNPVSRKKELFVRLCGKVYISFAGSDSSYAREGYLWEKGATTAACDRNWIEYNHWIFKLLYNARNYGRAVQFMGSLADQCGKRIEAKQRGWIYNDLALAELRSGDRERCLDYLREASAEKEAIAASPALGKAISYNETLCKGAGTPTIRTSR